MERQQTACRVQFVVTAYGYNYQAGVPEEGAQTSLLDYLLLYYSATPERRIQK